MVFSPRWVPGRVGRVPSGGVGNLIAAPRERLQPPPGGPPLLVVAIWMTLAC